ncbi:MAG: peptide chain release factor 1 [Rhodobacterales bacterium]|nr:peptide chain release factor 1 [Rhodobacterales bacterium]
MVPLQKLEQIHQRYEFLEAQMSAGISGEEIAKLSKEYSQLKPVVETIEEYKSLLADLKEAEVMLADPDMRQLAEEEIPVLKARVPEVEKLLQLALLPKDAADERSAMIEIRPGTGGDEAALFAADLLRMYQRFSETSGWTFEIIEEQLSELGGIKEVVIHVKGDGVFAKLKYESGVHRVQRVPETESGGRVHTSAATVAVLPEAEDVDIKIEQNDLRIDTMRSSGAGGQHVNTTYDLERQRVDSERSADRKSQVGSGDRSERIRTYNFPQGRVTDHRINLTLYKLDQVIQGDLAEMVSALIEYDQAEKLAEIGD